MKCIQCTSAGCGPFRCRFSNKTHAEYRQAALQAERYAQEMIRRDLERPQWERDFATGALDPANTWGGQYK